MLFGKKHVNFSFAIFFLTEPLFYDFGFLLHSSYWYSFSGLLSYGRDFIPCFLYFYVVVVVIVCS